jgi:phage gp29-like protein
LAGDTLTATIRPNGAVPAPGGSPATLSADLTRDYAAGGSGVWSAAALRSLPQSIDDITQDFGADLYERMLLDARVAAEVDNLKAAILEEGVNLAPAVDDADADGFALAATIHAAAERMLADCETPLDDVMWDTLAAIALGHRVAEVTYGPGDAGRLDVVAIRPKPRTSVAFVVDAFNRLVGLLARIPGQVGVAGLLTGLSVAATPPNLLPRAKFLVLSHRPVNADPRGTSLLRAAYTPWNLKQEVLREHVKYLAQFASPSLIGTLASNAGAIPEVDADGMKTGRMTRAVDALLTQLLAFRNGTALAVPFGTEVKELYSTGEGRAFLNSFSMYNEDIALAVSGQTLTTTEGEHGTRAQALVHQDTKGTRVKQAKKAAAGALRRDVLRVWVALNWGEAAARDLTPLVGLGEVEEEDVTPRWTAVAALQTAGYLTPSQKPQLDTDIGLPQRLPAETKAEQERASQPTPPAPGQQPGSQPGGRPANGNPPPGGNDQQGGR